MANPTLGIPTVHSKQYVFSGYYNKEKLTSKLSPVKNFIFLSDNIRGEPDKESEKFVLWRTNDVGKKIQE